jgi:hypothetical protein
MENTRNIINLVLKAVAVGMSVTSIVLGIIDVVEADVQITLLSVGLAALSIASLSEGDTEVDL